MKKFFSIVAILIFTMIAFVGCSNSFSSMADLPAVGNGGLCVAKGDYIYFVNGYASKTENLNKNKEGSVTKSGIYRIKTSNCVYSISGGTLSFDYGSVATDENGNITNAELIVSKVCGFENTSLYIFGDYIYYTTPNNQVSKNGTVYVNDIDYCRARLDGKKNTKLGTISVEESNYSKTKLGFYNLDSCVYFACFNGNSTLTISKLNKTSSKQTFIAEGVSDVLLPQISESFNSKQSNALDTSIFYIKDKILCKTTLENQNEFFLNSYLDNETFSFIGNNGSKLFYSIEKNSIKSIYKNDCISFQTNEKMITAGGSLYLSFSILDGSDYVVATTSDKIYVLDENNTILKEKSVASTTIVKTLNYNIFYLVNNNLYQINLFNNDPIEVLLTDSFSINESILNRISITNEIVYYFKTLEDGRIVIEMINYKDLFNGNVSIKQILANN